MTTTLSSPILDAAGKPFPRTTRLERLRRHYEDRLKAGYDAAKTTIDNERHWSQADGLSANAAANPEVRRVLRQRARYEANENNSIAKGIVLTLANDTIGTGPRLQLRTANADANLAAEREFNAWAREIRLAEKLRTMRLAKVIDGESFALQVTNPRLSTRVQLDLRLIEADHVTTPHYRGGQISERFVDGVDLDEIGNPLRYHVLDQHPGGLGSLFAEAKPIAADKVIHWFRADRPGQARGVSEITPALPLFAQLRRFTLTVIAAAETAAAHAALIYTDSPALDVEDLAPLSSLPLEMRSLLSLPAGWKVEQLRSEQPATTYEMFKREIIKEIARCLNMPYNVAAGDSAKHNYASGRLDHQIYHRAIYVERDHCEMMVLNRIFRWWLDEAELIEGYLPAGLFPLPFDAVEWQWDGFEHVDPSKEAGARDVNLRNGTTTRFIEYAKAGRDMDAEDQRAAESYGVSLAEYRAKLFAATFAGGATAIAAPSIEEDEDEDEEEDEAADE